VNNLARFLGSSFILLTCVFATLAVSAALAENDPFGSANTPPVPKAQTEAVGSGQRQLGVLRRQRGPQDVLPAVVQTALQREGYVGENPKLGRRALTTTFGRSYFVVPGADDVICLVNEAGASLCPPLDLVQSGRFTGSEACAPGDASRYVMFGMVPDQAGGSVSIGLSDGTERRAAVRDNVYALTIARALRPTLVSWRGSAGQVESIEPYVDSAVGSARCSRTSR